MLRSAFSVVLIPILAATVQAQDFEPFGDVSGTIRLWGTYSEAPGNTLGEVEQVESIELLYDVQQTSFDSTNGYWNGVQTRAEWAQGIDHYPIEEPPNWAKEGYEWRFRLTGEGGTYQRGGVEFRVQLELTEWVEVSVRATIDKTPMPAAVSVQIGGLAAWYKSSIGAPISQGPLVDRYFNRSVVLGPGVHHLDIDGLVSTVGPHPDPNAFDVSVQVHFAPAACPSDLNGDRVLDLGDIQAFITAFLLGC